MPPTLNRSLKRIQRTYPITIPIGLGLLIGLCALLMHAAGSPRSRTTATPVVSLYADLATSAVQTALALQLGTLQAPTATDAPLPALTVTATAISPAPLPRSNPWAANIPEAACIPFDLPQSGLVVGVIDGRTIRVLLDGDGHVYSVRYLGIGDSSADAAAQNAALVYHKKALLVRDITDSDSNGSLLRYVLIEGTFINYSLVAGGYASADSRPPDTACADPFKAAEAKALAAGLGMWSASGHIIPLPTSP
jgi:endonuclease YncB( thermonuclease family)